MQNSDPNANSGLPPTFIPGMGGLNPTGSNISVNPSQPTSNAPIGGGTLLDSPLFPSGSSGVPGSNTMPINNGPAGTFNPTALAGLTPSAGFGLPSAGSPQYTQLQSQLDGIFGSGMGQVLLGYITNGAGFNPQVATALQNAQIPQEQRALANIRETFGARGLGGGSNEALAYGDYESAFNLGQEGILADLYQGANNNISGMLSGVLNTAFLDKSNKNGVLDTINSLLPILGALGLTGAGGSLGNLLKGILGKLTGSKSSGGGGGGVGGGGGTAGSPGASGGGGVYGNGPDVGDPNLIPTMSMPIPGDPSMVATPPFSTGVIPGVTGNTDIGSVLNIGLPGNVTNVNTNITDPITGQPIDSSSGGGGGSSNLDSWWSDPSSWDGSSGMDSATFNYQNGVLDSSLFGGVDTSSF